MNILSSFCNSVNGLPKIARDFAAAGAIGTPTMSCSFEHTP